MIRFDIPPPHRERGEKYIPIYPHVMSCEVEGLPHPVVVDSDGTGMWWKRLPIPLLYRNILLHFYS
jgi:hypothetical protein